MEQKRAGKDFTLADMAGQPSDQVLKFFGNSLDGYDRGEAARQRLIYGRNEISKAKKDSLAKTLFLAFITPFTLVLLVLAGVSLFTDVIMAAGGKHDYTAFIIVITMVCLSGTLTFVQERKSGKAAQKLSQMVKTMAAVMRDGRKAELPIGSIVAGDVICLAGGDMIPADCRILDCKDLFISQSSLTGESSPIEKFAFVTGKPPSNPLDLENMAFMGSNVVSGTATVIALKTGDNTIFGGIARQLGEKAPPTSFDKGVKSVSWVLIRFMLVMVPAVLFINGFTKGDWMQALLFALAVGVGLTPELLPMIVSTNLAKGAVDMSRRKVIVKRLNSIQNFGAIDILCTDKTGTITQDRVILEYHFNVRGREDRRVLDYGFLNSHYQTGLKNLMDISIIQRAQEEGVATDALKQYRKIDEIPFDFNRRRMSVVIEGKDEKYPEIITKGAIEEILAVCKSYDDGAAVKPLTPAMRRKIAQACAKLNKDGLRVLGVARKALDHNRGFTVKDESGMILVGYLAFLDPPKEGAKKAIASLLDHGVRVKVLTGDNGFV
ncbi:MAG: magnesium-translocating P-type ATPase, partial [Alphaproteobacteria bacterium]|nr:magnesium-translocating P-type ATPase [Alphaproteobacteria bacterium]